MEDQSVLETIEDSFLDLVDSAVEYAPRVLAALLLLLVGFIVARFVSKWLGKAVDYIEDDKRVMNTADALGVNVLKISDVVALVTRWAVLLIFVSAAVDALGVDVLTDTFNSVLGYVPNVFAAAVIAGVAVLVGNVVKDIVATSAEKAGVKSASFLGSAARVAVLIFGVPLAAAQLGLDLTIINNNITVIVAGIMLALALAFGLGGRDVAGKILEDQYKNWKK